VLRVTKVPAKRRGRLAYHTPSCEVLSDSRYNDLVKQNATLDSSFWINAHRAGLLSNVLQRFSLSFAPAVAAELSRRFASGREFWRLVGEGVLTEANPQADLVKAFGSGERGAMNLALEHRDWILLVDDRRPLLEAQRLGLKTLCTPVLVVDLFDKEKWSLPEAVRALASLAAMRTVSPALLEAALAQLEVMRGRKET
jgi:predicted nucleic acid-binding protein